MVVSQSRSVGVGGTPADANSIELGRGYINLARDDTASAKQITFGKNGSVHSSIETTTSQFKINSSVNTLNFTGTTYSINGFETAKFTSSGGYEFGDLSEDDRDVTIRAFANTAKIFMTDGSVAITGALSKTSGSFKIDHPLKPETHHLVHSFVEGPQADNLYRGKIELVSQSRSLDPKACRSLLSARNVPGVIPNHSSRSITALPSTSSIFPL